MRLRRRPTVEMVPLLEARERSREAARRAYINGEADGYRRAVRELVQVVQTAKERDLDLSTVAH